MLDFWYAALRSAHGIVLRTDDPERAKARLYAARAEAGDPALESISICLPRPGELWLVRTDSNRG